MIAVGVDRKSTAREAEKMALLRRLFARKALDGLPEISNRLYRKPHLHLLSLSLPSSKRCSNGVSSPVKTPTPSSSSVGSARSDTRPEPSSPPLRALRASKEVVSPNGDRRSSSTSISPPLIASSSRASSSSPSRRSGFAPSAPPPPRSKLSSGGALPSSPRVGRSATPTRGGAPPASSPRGGGGGGGAPPREASSPRAAAAAAARVTRRFEKLLH